MQRAIDELYRDHGADAVRLALLLTGDRARAEDIAHDAFARVLGRLTAIRDRDALHAYLKRTVVNLSKNHHRREGLRRRYLASSSHESDTAAMPDLETRDELHKELLALPYRQRAALVLRYCEDLSEADVAEALNTSAKAIRSLVGRGLAALRDERKEG